VWSNGAPAEISCRLLLVRHATAAGNGRFQGQRDVSLTTAGQQELDLLVEKCSQHPVRVVYSSDLERARHTACAVARRFGLEVEVRPALREMHFGQWQGLSWEQVRNRFPELARQWTEHFPRQPIPGAELFREFKRRVDREVRAVVAANRGGCALVVTHAGVIRVTLAKVLGLPQRNLFRLAQGPCALNVIDYFDEGTIVQCING
jgi:broad specificity phosphatase PhoE